MAGRTGCQRPEWAQVERPKPVSSAELFFSEAAETTMWGGVGLESQIKGTP